MSALLGAVALLALGAPYELPEVRFVTKVVTRSWEPIAIREVERMVQEAVEEPLTAPGKMRLSASSAVDLRGGDYALRVGGRFVEEAERFTVYLELEPGTRDDLPSLFASDTSEALGRKSRAEMEKRIRAAARRASTRLAEAVGPWLDQIRLDVSAPPIGADQVPMSWGPIEIPAVDDRREAIRILLDPRRPNPERGKALAELKGHAFDQQPARNALERCVLRDPTPEIRVACAAALRPVARAHVPTQRVLLHALRTDVDDQVLSTIIDISKGFVGLSRKETIATWLHMLASDATPTRAAEKAARLLAKEKNLPNLEGSVAACLQQEVVVYGKRYACASSLLTKIPAARRPPVVWRYLTQTPVFGSGERLSYEAVLRAVYEGRDAKPDEALRGLLLDLAERPATGRLRYKAVHLAGRLAPATAQTVERLLKLAHQPRLAASAIRGAVEVAKRNPALADMTLAALERLGQTARWYPRPNRGEPRRDLDDALERLQRSIDKAKR